MGCSSCKTIEDIVKEKEKIQKFLEEKDLNLPILKESNISYADYPLDDLISKIPSELEKNKERLNLWIELNDKEEIKYISYKRLHYNLTEKLDIPDIIRKKNPIKFAYEVACDAYSRENISNKNFNFLEFIEFRIFLLYLKEYFEYWKYFNYLENNGEHKITLDEFKNEKLISLMKRFGCEFKNDNEIKKEFSNIDNDENGIISFEEFCDIIIQESIDIKKNEKENCDNEELKRLKTISK